MTTEPKFICPYDKTHQIFASRLPLHILKCKRNHNSQEMVQCPYDACHVIKKIYYKQHILNCASSGNMQSYLYSLEPQRRIGIPLEYSKTLRVPVMKDWDQEYVETYNPWQESEKKMVIRCLIVAPKSKKKQFKLAERRRTHLLERINTEWNIIATCDTLRKLQLRNIHNSMSVKILSKKLARLTVQDLDELLEGLDFNKLFINSPTKASKKLRITSEVEHISRKKDME